MRRRPSSPRSPSDDSPSTPKITNSNAKSIRSTKQQVSNIHMRPNFDKILKHSIIGECFRKYCTKTMVIESLDCLQDIRKYKNLLLSILNENTSNNSNISSNSNNLNSSYSSNSTNSNYSNVYYDIYKTAFEILNKIVEIYFKKECGKEINVDDYSKEQILNTLNSNPSLDLYSNNLTLKNKLEIFDNLEMEILILLKGDVLPRFIRSEDWQLFILENEQVSNECCDEEDLEIYEKLKFTKTDFQNESITKKDVEFSELMISDMSCLQCILQDDIIIFVSKGKQFIDEKSFNIGKFFAHKSLGYIPCSSEVLITALQNPDFIQKIMPSTTFDESINAPIDSTAKNNYSSSSIFIGYDKNGSIEKGTFPSYFCKFHVKIAGIFDVRTTIAANTVFYSNGKYIFLSRSIIDPDKYPICKRYISKNGKLKEKKTVESIIINIYIVSKISDHKCHFIQFTLSNMKGMLNVIANAFFPQTIGKVAQNQRETIVKEILESKENRYESLRDTFHLTHEYLNLVSTTMNMPPPTMFPNTFEEFQNRFVQ